MRFKLQLALESNEPGKGSIPIDIATLDKDNTQINILD